MPNIQNLTEVLCSLRFDPLQNVWDSTYFGRYYERVAKRGYTEKKEQNNLEIPFDPANSQNIQVGVPIPLKSRMIFSNPEMKSAIIMAEHFISFHKLETYESWDKLMTEIVFPGLEDYEAIGLGKGIIEVQSLYLNKYRIENYEDLNNRFAFLPVVVGATDSQITYQGLYDLDAHNVIQLKLNSPARKSLAKDTFFECSCLTKRGDQKEDFLHLAKSAHDNINKVYNSITKSI
jgi:uncharacterized protein (TIGR04255 family)